MKKNRTCKRARQLWISAGQGFPLDDEDDVAGQQVSCFRKLL